MFQWYRLLLSKQCRFQNLLICFFLNIERSEELEEQNESVTISISISVAYLRFALGLVNSLCLLCPQSALVPLQTDNFARIICYDFSWNSVYKWCRFVKTMHECQNSGVFKMSKHCRYVRILQVYFVEMVRVYKTRLHPSSSSHHHLHLYSW